MAILAPSESLFSRVKNIVTENRNKLDATAIRILGILKARGLLRDARSIIADFFQDIEKNRDANKDVFVADDTPTADDAIMAGDASSAQSSAESSDEQCFGLKP